MADNPAQIPELPSKQATDRLASLVEPYRRITAPKFYGIGSLPDDGSPCLLAFHLPGSLAAGGLPLGQRPAFLPAPGEERNQADHDLWNQRGGPPHEAARGDRDHQPYLGHREGTERHQHRGPRGAPALDPAQ